MSAYNAGQRFGVLDIDENGHVKEFREKTQGDGNLINIGFMVCQPEFIDYIEGDNTVLEKSPLETVAKLGQLMAYKHDGLTRKKCRVYRIDNDVCGKNGNPLA